MKSITNLLIIIVIHVKVSAQTHKEVGLQYKDSCDAGYSHFYKRNYKQAVAAFDFCIKKTTDNFEKAKVSRYKGISNFKLGNFTKFEADFALAFATLTQEDAAVVAAGKYTVEFNKKLSQYFGNALVDYADCKCEQKKVDEAIRKYDEAIKNYKSNPAKLSKAQCLRKNKQTDAAIAILNELNSTLPNKGALLTEFGIIEFEKNNIAKAKQLFIDAEKDLMKLYDGPIYYQGLIEMKEGNFKEAIKFFHKALLTVNNSPDSYAKIGEAYAWLKQLDSANRYFEIAKNEFAQKKLVDDLIVIIARQKLEQITPETIVHNNKEFIKLYQRANQLKKERRLPETIDVVNAALKIDNDNSDLLTLSGELWLLIFEAVNKDYDDNPNFDFSKNEDWKNAIMDLEDAVEINPKNGTAYYWLGAAYLIANDKVKAKKNLEIAKKYLPNSKVVNEAIKTLNN